MLQNKIGKEIKHLREKKGYSQEVLGEKTGISTLHIGYIEQGRREPKFKTLIKIADVLNVKVRDLITF